MVIFIQRLSLTWPTRPQLNSLLNINISDKCFENLLLWAWPHTKLLGNVYETVEFRKLSVLWIASHISERFIWIYFRTVSCYLLGNFKAKLPKLLSYTPPLSSILYCSVINKRLTLTYPFLKKKKNNNYIYKWH